MDHSLSRSADCPFDDDTPLVVSATKGAPALNFYNTDEDYSRPRAGCELPVDDYPDRIAPQRTR